MAWRARRVSSTARRSTRSRSGGWRDLVTLLHPPYTAWHLSYVALGAAAAPHIYANRLAAALAAFFLAVGISAHALDELNGRPLETKLTPLDADRAGGDRLRRRDRRSASPGSIVVSPLLVAARARRRAARARLQPRARRRALPHRHSGSRSPGAGFRRSPATSSTRSRSARPGLLVAGGVLPAERGPAPVEHAGARAAAATPRR